MAVQTLMVQLPLTLGLDQFFTYPVLKPSIGVNSPSLALPLRYAFMKVIGQFNLVLLLLIQSRHSGVAQSSALQFFLGNSSSTLRLFQSSSLYYLGTPSDLGGSPISIFFFYLGVRCN